MGFFKKVLNVAVLSVLVLLPLGCKQPKYDYSYLENLPAQIPEDITPSSMPEYKKVMADVPVRIDEVIPEVEQNLDEEALKIWEQQKTLPVYARQKTPDILRVGMLLPLSGKSEKIGQAMLNSAMLAVSESGNKKIILQFYDTEDTTEAAALAAQKAADEGVRLIIGPLYSAQVAAVADEIGGKGIDIISFSSDPAVVSYGVYSVALLIPEQVQKVVSYACSQGYKKLAVLTQSNEMGEYAFAGAKQAVESQECGGAIVQMGFYNPSTTDFSDAVKNILPSALLVKLEKEKLKEQGYEVIEETLYDEEGNPINEQDIEFDFDAILLADEGTRLRSLGALLDYYDITPDKFKILGISAMDDAKVKKEAIFADAWYASLPRNNFNRFVKKYQKIYGIKENPPRIATLAYDAVSLAAFISDKQGNMNELIANPAGFSGIDGAFRLLPDGRAERAMAIMQVRKKGSDKVIVAPEKQFTSAPLQKVERQTPELTPKPEETEEILQEIIVPVADEVVDAQVSFSDEVFVPSSDKPVVAISPVKPDESAVKQ